MAPNSSVLFVQLFEHCDRQYHKWVLNDVAREYYMNFNLIICLLIMIHNLCRQIPNMQIDSSLQIFCVAVDEIGS